MTVFKHPTKGDGWWYIQYLPEGRSGKKKSIPFKGTRAEAHAWELEIRKQARPARTVGSVSPAIQEILPLFIDAYRIDHQPAGVARTIRSFEVLMPTFGRLSLSAITGLMVEEYKAKRLSQSTARSRGQECVKPTTINKELAALSALLKWAAEHGYCHPIKIKRFTPKMTKAPLPRPPTIGDVEKVISAAPWPKQGLLACLFYGGLRSQEGRTLKVEDVRLDLGGLFITGKGGKERFVPVVDKLRPVLERRLSEVKSGYLWTWPPGNAPIKDLRGVLLWACKRAGVDRHITPHQFRHAFGVEAIVGGAKMRGLQQVMGHSSVSTTEGYTQLAAARLKGTMGSFGEDEFATVANNGAAKRPGKQAVKRKTHGA